MKRIMIYCDFDGTITTKDNIIALMKKFAPTGWEAIKDNILAQKISIRKGVASLFQLLPSSKKSEYIDFLLSEAQIRPGFSDFVAFTRQKGMELRIVSGGIDFFVYPILEDLVPASQIYCNKSDFTGEMITIQWPHSCDSECTNDCGCCKTSIIRKLRQEGDYTIVIGDSITDLEPAKHADYVLACDDFLAKKCKEQGLHYDTFDTFFDVIDRITFVKNKVEK